MDRRSHPQAVEHRSKFWLSISLSLNFLLIQWVVLTIEAGLRPLWTGFTPLYLVGWGLLSVLLAGILGWLLAAELREDEISHWAVRLLFSLAVLIGIFSSSNPDHSWFGYASLNLLAYPLAGLELKSLAVLLGVVALKLESDPTKGRVEELAPMEVDRSEFPTGAIALGSAAVVLALAVGIPVISGGASVLAAPIAVEPQPTVVSILPEEGYQLPASYQKIGPALLEAGAIDLARFVSHFEATNEPLSSEQITILEQGSSAPIVIHQGNARFLLNLFWAFGLTNRNPLLQEGQMQAAAEGEIGRFASTGGWTLGSSPGAELYASRPIVELTRDQQTLVEEIASQLYRPCCNNPTSFPDCNHGMAMLGMLEWMANQGASEADMWEAAKYVNAYWFTPQMTEVGMLFDAAKDVGFERIPGEEALGPALFSGSGFRNLHAFLQAEGLLQGESGGGASCGV